MARFFVALALLILVATGARAQEPDINLADQAAIDQIEAQLTAQGLEADIDAATDEQVAIAVGQLVNPSRGPSELAALMRGAALARPEAAEAILREATGAAADQGFSAETIGLMLAAVVDALQDSGVAYDLDSLITVVAEATGLSEAVVAEAAAEAGAEAFAEEEDLIEEENPNQDASPT